MKQISTRMFSQIAFLAGLPVVLFAGPYEMFDNNGFEDGLNGWKMFKGRQGELAITAHAKDGKKAIRVTGRNHENCSPAQEIVAKVEKDKLYEFRAWVKIDRPGYVVLKVRYATTKITGGTWVTFKRSHGKETPAHQWVEISGSGKIVGEGELMTVTPIVIYWYGEKEDYPDMTIDNISFTDPTQTPKVPPAPDKLKAAALANGGVELMWSDESLTEDGFEILRTVDTTSTWSLAGKVGPNEISFVDSQTQPQTTYYYCVRAYNKNGYSEPTSVCRVTTAPPTSVAKPTFIKLRYMGPDLSQEAWEYDVFGRNMNPNGRTLRFFVRFAGREKGFCVQRQSR